MSKKIDMLPANERARKYGNEIMGVGIFYLVILVILTILQLPLLLNPILLVIRALQIALLVALIIGGKKRSRLGVKAGIAFEIYMIVASILLIVLSTQGPDLIALLVMIFLPFDIKGLSKALDEMENQSFNQNVDNSNYMNSVTDQPFDSNNNDMNVNNW